MGYLMTTRLNTKGVCEFHVGSSNYLPDIQQQATDNLTEEGVGDIHLSFYLTSIYDHSIFEAFSKVIQKLIPQLPTLENLLGILTLVGLSIFI